MQNAIFKGLSKKICHFIYCSVNGQYVKQGKLGIAVLGDQKNADVCVDKALVNCHVL